jgi:hypothetical protein
MRAKDTVDLDRVEHGAKLTPRRAIVAMCASCMCRCYADGRVDCRICKCPLYPYVPYRDSAGDKKACV